MKNIFFKIKLYGPIQFLKFLVREAHYKIWTQRVKNSFSQWGEDQVIDSIIRKKTGFYVDIGANDPKRFNNTYKFYRMGWNGINIEPSVECFQKLRMTRRRDINLNIGIGRANKNYYYYAFEPNTLSTFSKSTADKYQKMGFKLMEKRKVRMVTLSSIFSKYVKNSKIDFLTVDTEGSDLRVLMTNNWQKYKPDVICVELARRKLKRHKLLSYKKGLTSFLEQKGYKEHHKSDINGIFVRIKQ